MSQNLKERIRTARIDLEIGKPQNSSIIANLLREVEWCDKDLEQEISDLNREIFSLESEKYELENELSDLEEENLVLKKLLDKHGIKYE